MTLALAAAARRWVVQTASRPYLALYTEDAAGLTEDGSWFRALVGGMPEARFRVEWLDPGTPDGPITAGLSAAGWPSQVSLGVAAPTLPPEERRDAAQRREQFETALAALVKALGESEPVPGASDSAFEVALAALSRLSWGRPLSPLLLSDAAARRVLAAWREVARPAPASGPSRLTSPSVAEALALCRWLCGVLRPLEAQPPAANLAHAVGSGAPGLAALHGLWRNATPFVFSEPQVALRRHYLEGRRDGSPNLGIMRLRFERRLARSVYRRASAVVAGSERVRRWQVQLGAPPAQVLVRSGGLHLSRQEWLSQPVAPEPAGAVVVWCGDVVPGAGLETLLRAFDLVRRQRPEARLRLFGTAAPGHLGEMARCQALIVSLRLGGWASFEALPPDRADLYRAAQVVVLSGSDGEVPAALIEAMTLGRAVAAVRVGGVADVLGAAGLLSAPRDLLALTRHLLRLLGDPALRGQLAAAGRQRAALFSADAWVELHRQLYAQVLADEAARSAEARFAPSDFEFGDGP